MASSAAAQPDSRREVLLRQGRALIRAIREDDEAAVEAAIVALSRSRRIFAPLAFVVGAFVMLFNGLKLLVVNWRLLVLESLPALWIWLAMLDLKVHALHGRETRTLYGAAALAAMLGIGAVTVAAFYLNAVFAFAIAEPGRPEIRPAFRMARRSALAILSVGVVLGATLAFAAVVTGRWGRWPFTLALGAVVGAMMVAYVSVPARLLGRRAIVSRRDKIVASVIAGTLGALVCAPPYAIGRLGVYLLDSRPLFVIGVLLLAIGVLLQAGATGAVKAIKMSTKLIPAGAPASRTDQPAEEET